MNHNWIMLSVFAATALLVAGVASIVYEWFFRYRLTVRARLQELGAGDDDEGGISLFKDLQRRRGADGETLGWRAQFVGMCEQAGITCSPEGFVGWCVALGLSAAAAGLWRGIGWSVAAFPLGAVVPLVVIYMRRHFRRRALCRQLPEAFEMMSRAVRAGQTVPAALKIIAEDFEAPISEEFTLCYEQQNLGISREMALRMLAERTGIMELQIFVVALLVQARFGGDLAELLANLAAMIRKRFKLADRVRALTGEGRMQATVLMILPIAALAALLMISPQYIGTLLDRPWILGATLAVQAVGIVWIQRIVRFEV
jgi:tight adherence protein B